MVRLETHNKALLLKFLHKFFNNQIFPGLTWFGATITVQPGYLVAKKLAPFGGKACLLLSKITRDWLPQLSGMEEPFFFGKICGIRASRLINTLSYFPSLATANLPSKKLSKRNNLLKLATSVGASL